MLPLDSGLNRFACEITFEKLFFSPFLLLQYLFLQQKKKDMHGEDKDRFWSFLRKRATVGPDRLNILQTWFLYNLMDNHQVQGFLCFSPQNVSSASSPLCGCGWIRFE